MTVPGSSSGSRATSAESPLLVSLDLAKDPGLQPEDYGVLFRLVLRGPMRDVNLKVVVAELRSGGWRMSADRFSQCLNRLKVAGYVHHAAEYNEETGRPVWTLRASMSATTTARPALPGPRAVQVYAIRDRKTRHVKIGISIDPNKRLSSLQTGAPAGMRLLWTGPGGRPLERHLHKHFADRHVRGEWFDFSGCDAVEMIAQAASVFGGAQ